MTHDEKEKQEEKDARKAVVFSLVIFTAVILKVFTL